MKNFLIKNTLYLLTGLAGIVAILVAVNWSSLPVVQRMVSLFFCGLVMHLWEEGKFPGGFTEMFTAKLNFTQRNPHFGELITITYVLAITLVPLFFPNLIWLAMAPMFLGLVEGIAHLGAIKMFKLQRPYSPGMVTALVVLLPLSIYTIVYVIQNDLMQPVAWLFSFLYMLFGLLLAQQIVVRASGMKYTDFLKSVRATIFAK